ncbi:MAG TPA: hypothetical protein VNA20_05010 [Frankiaceae bacterium]|nr:hypothetical protein [Frankiaceae bacterium]
MTDDAAGRAALVLNRRRIDRLTAAATALSAARRPVAAIHVATAAAELAWHRHGGVYRLPRVERLLRRWAVPAPPARVAGEARTVLHVLSSAYDFGGHSRFATRWIERDAGRRARVFLTEQPPDVDPEWLRGLAVERHGPREPVRARAVALARACATADVVVLHVHPQDPVPLLALPPGTPSILLNHADHACWLDAGVTVVAHIRESARRLADERRGLPDGSILPVPVDPRPLPDRAAARKALGLPGDAVVALTIGSNFKYGDGTEFLRLCEPMLAAYPALFVLAVGPSGPAWERDRVRALGVVPDVGPALAASDLYLDSWPYSSLTSMLDAAAAGLPTIGRQLPEISGTFEAVDSPGLARHVVATDDATWRAALDRLVASPEARRSAGAALAADVTAVHGRGWRDHLDAVYARALAGPPQRRVDPPGFVDSPADRRLATVYRDDPNYPGLPALLHRRAGAAEREGALVLRALAKAFR